MISRRSLLLGLAAVATPLAACSGIPSSGQVADVGKASVSPGSANDAVGPTPGQPQDAIVRGFITASGRISLDSGTGVAIQAAQQYLTPDARRRWPTSATQVIILSTDYRVDISDTDPTVATISGVIEGTLDATGAFHLSSLPYRQQVRLAKVQGQWRIATPNPDLVIQQKSFAQTYVARIVYFLDASSTVVVPDQRYISSSAEKRAGKMMDLLLTGPAGVLAGVARTQLGQAQLRRNVVIENGVTVVDITGTVPSAPAARRALAAQVVFSLSRDADLISITVEDQPLEPNQPPYTLSSFQSFDPDRTPGTGTAPSDPYYVDPSGRILGLTDNRPMWGRLGDGSLVVTAASMSAATGAVGAVTRLSDGTAQLVIGNPLEYQNPIGGLRADLLTTPSFSRSGDEIWVVQNGNSKPEVYQVSASVLADETPSRVKISSPPPIAASRAVTALQVSPDGVRVAVVADSKLFLGAVSFDSAADSPAAGTTEANPPAGAGKTAVSIVNLRELRGDLVGVGAVAFNSSTELMVAAFVPGNVNRTVSRVSIDGSDSKPVTSTDMTNDVQSIAVAGPDQGMYVTFSGRVYQLVGGVTEGHWVTPSFTTGLLAGSSPFFPN